MVPESRSHLDSKGEPVDVYEYDMILERMKMRNGGIADWRLKYVKVLYFISQVACIVSYVSLT